MSKENQKELKKHELLMSGIMNWASETTGFMDPVELSEEVEDMYTAFLESYHADDMQSRTTKMVLHQHLQALFKILSGHAKEDFNEMDKFNFNLTQA